MKIVAGKFKGKRLLFKKTKDIRPMTEKVRSAIYDILQDWVQGKIMLDLFCGSGSVGIEAISRGAAHVDFVDLEVKTVSMNVDSFGLKDQVSIFRNDVFRALEVINKKQKKYDFIFIGAPYPFTRIPEILKKIDDFAILSHKGLLILEHVKGLKLDLALSALNHKRTYMYGQTILELYESAL